MASLDEALAGVFEKARYAIPIVHAEADYLRPLRHGETLHVRLHVKRLGTSSFTLGYAFLGPEGKDVRARVSTVHALVDLHLGRAVPLPTSLRNKLMGYSL